MCYFASIFHVLTRFRAAMLMLQTFQTTIEVRLGRGSILSDADGVDELHGNDLTNLTPRLKSLQHNTLQPENGSAHGICWQCNIVEQEQNNAITTCIFGWWKALWL